MNNSILIADSGSTKTDWCLINENGDQKTVQTIGINPYLMNANAIREVLEKELNPYIYPETVKEIYYYGAGCSTIKKCLTVDNVLQDFFSRASIEVHHDMLGAARALCGSEPGIACILGTGSNSCYFDGRDIADSMISLGYLFGDEGSGAHMGKKLLTAYFSEEMPDEIRQRFEHQYAPSVESILDAVYNQPRPSRFLASFSPFLLAECNHSYIRNLITSCFDEFLHKNVSKYNNYQSLKVNFVGSIAFFFRDLLLESAGKAGITTGTIHKSAIEGLIDYHSN